MRRFLSHERSPCEAQCHSNPAGEIKSIRRAIMLRRRQRSDRAKAAKRAVNEVDVDAHLGARSNGYHGPRQGSAASVITGMCSVRLSMRRCLMCRPPAGRQGPRQLTWSATI